jgi:hypothetical protein
MTVTKELDPWAPLKHLCREVERRGSRPATQERSNWRRLFTHQVRCFKGKTSAMDLF